MEWVIRPFVGVRLGLGTLAFGTDPATAASTLDQAGLRVSAHRQCAAPGYDDVGPRNLADAHDAWLSGLLYDAAWNFDGRSDDLTVDPLGGAPTRRESLARIRVSVRMPAAASGAPHADAPQAGPAVVWDGIDLAREPLGDIAACLPEAVRGHDPTQACCASSPLGLRVRDRGPWRDIDCYDRTFGSWPCCRGQFRCEAGGAYVWSEGLTSTQQRRARPRRT